LVFAITIYIKITKGTTVDGNFDHVLRQAKGGKCYVALQKCNKGPLTNIGLK